MKIFNLAEELEKERKKNKELEERRKKDNYFISGLSRENKEQQDIIIKLVERIDKAIKYIYKQTTDEDTGKDLGYSDNIEYEYLLDILKGEKND
jgi:hypothetical protein